MNENQRGLPRLPTPPQQKDMQIVRSTWLGLDMILQLQVVLLAVLILEFPLQPLPCHKIQEDHSVIVRFSPETTTLFSRKFKDDGLGNSGHLNKIGNGRHISVAYHFPVKWPWKHLRLKLA